MDLHNNNVGRNIGSYSTFNSLLNNVLYALNQGQLYYLNNLDSDFNCTAKSISNLIPTNQ
ncbi:MAG: hypothetical protein H7250_10695 [Flavobacterium sp.]|nr:hypothetical protein [Flavobacterium sp.]